MNPQPPRTPSGIWFWLIIFIGIFMLITFSRNVSSGSSNLKQLTVTELYSEIEKGNVKELTLLRRSGEVKGLFKPIGDKLPVGFISNVADIGELEKRALTKGLPLKVQDSSSTSGFEIFLSVILSLLPFVLIMVVFWMIFRSARNGMDQHNGQFAGHFNIERNISTRFKDLAGCDEVVEEAQDIVDFLTHPEIYREAGIEAPKGLLLEGAPGVGKTLLARAIAGEAGVKFFAVSGSDFVETFVGVGARRIRDLFAEARKQSPCIVFIDEIDAVGKKRTMTMGSHLEHEQTLAALLAEMDGFDETVNLLVIGASNVPDVLDPALLRRFSRKIEMPYPDTKGREAILQVHTRGKKLAEDVDFAELAKMTSGFSGDDLKNLAQEASRVAVEYLLKTTIKELAGQETRHRIGSIIRGKLLVTRADFYEAFETNTLGRARKSRVVSKIDREVTAYHESGHALAVLSSKNAEPLGKVTIVPRGRAGGFTTQIPEDHMFLTKEQLFARLVVLMGGRAAEMKKFSRESTGASADFQQATAIALAMVAKYGMNDKVGKMVYLDEHQYLKGVAQLNCSPEMRLVIEEEAKKLVDEAYAATVKIIDERAAELEKLAQILLEKETLDGKEIAQMLASV